MFAVPSIHTARKPRERQFLAKACPKTRQVRRRIAKKDADKPPLILTEPGAVRVHGRLFVYVQAFGAPQGQADNAIGKRAERERAAESRANPDVFFRRVMAEGDGDEGDDAFR